MDDLADVTVSASSQYVLGIVKYNKKNQAAYKETLILINM